MGHHMRRTPHSDHSTDSDRCGGSGAFNAPRRTVLAAGLSALAGPVIGQSAAAAYPSQPVRIVGPSAPGGTTDLYARILGKALGESLGQPFVIENKPGAGSVIGTDAVVKSKPDGHTLLFGSLPLSTNPGLMAKLPYDAQQDLRPVIHISAQGFVVSVGPKSPFATFADAIAAAKQRDVPYATPGIGTVGHLSAQMLNVEHGTRFIHVAYRGSAPAIQDVVAGQVDLLFDAMASSSAAIASGQLRPVATTNATRFAALPNVPTLRELGYAAGEGQAYSGLLVPAATPTEIVTKLNAALNAAFKRPDVRQSFERLNVTPVGGTPDAFGQLIRQEGERWVPLIRRLGLKAE